MSTAPEWLTVDDVAGYLDLPGSVVDAGDDNLTLSTAAWRAAVERRHPSYFDAADPPVYFPPADIRLGAIRAAALTYQSRNAPSGFAGYGDETMLFDSLGAQRAEIMRQLRWRFPVAL
jgi:hypothetical protein